MGWNFQLELAGEERRYLLGLARLAVERGLAGGLSEDELPPPPPSATLQSELGAFVTLRRSGSLRGCIGSIAGDGPLYRTVARMATAAAFEDPRFPPVSPAEAGGLEYEISVLGPVEPCRYPEEIVIGRHGLILRQGGRQGLLLPQVPLEWGWDRPTFLRQTCLKANLPPEEWQNAWRPGSLTRLYWFEAVIFTE